MKNFKRGAAIAAIVILLAVFCLPMVFALKGDFSRGGFQASLFAALFLPILAFAVVLVYRWLDNRKTEKSHEESSEIDTVVFDVGRVLVGFEYEPLMDSFSFSEEKKEKIINATFRNEIWNEMDRALYENEEYFRRFIAEAPEYEAEIREVLRRAPETVETLPYAETWVKYLKKQGYRVFALSNYGNYMMEHTKQHLGFLEYMDGAIFSCDVQMIKPEPDIYQNLMERYHIDPARAVFIDDRADNCATARSLGMKSIQFRDFRQAAGELEKLGVR